MWLVVERRNGQNASCQHMTSDVYLECSLRGSLGTDSERKDLWMIEPHRTPKLPSSSSSGLSQIWIPSFGIAAAVWMKCVLHLMTVSQYLCPSILMSLVEIREYFWHTVDKVRVFILLYHLVLN
jgi:hypothetical protein